MIFVGFQGGKDISYINFFFLYLNTKLVIDADDDNIYDDDDVDIDECLDDAI